jgi:pimeloyl-ACP methyl ester carboxylesterase
VSPPAARPFVIAIPDEDLADLRRRLGETRWPAAIPGTGWEYGTDVAWLQELCAYWREGFDWRAQERVLNAWPQALVAVDGLDIHCVHVEGRGPDPIPLVATHGWPSSSFEMHKIIAPLTDPTAHGASASDAFDIVIPSLPGYGFSAAPTAVGWDPIRIARTWTVLMKRLGYTRYVAQGGDWGNAVTEQMALLAPPELVGIHTNMPAAVPDDIEKALHSGNPPPSGLSADEKYAYDQLDFFYKHGLAYAQEMHNRPQTLYAIEDSPIGLAAWMLDHDIRSYELITRVFAGQPEGLTRDDILDNVTLYWLTNTAVSSARLYWESNLPFFAPKGIAIPVAVSAFPDEIYTAPRSWTEKAYSKLIHYNRMPKGGHFAAWEQPALFVQEMRASFRSLHQA